VDFIIFLNDLQHCDLASFALNLTRLEQPTTAFLLHQNCIADLDLATIKAENSIVGLHPARPCSFLFVAEGIVHLIFKAIEQYRRPRGMTLRVDMGGRVAVLDDVNPNSAEELRKLQNETPEQK
jgi:hypothetical protein